MFADIEQAILDRLRAKLPATVHVAPERDIKTASEARQKAPAVWVISNGYSVGDRIAPGVVQQIRQEWLVVIATRSAKGAGGVAAARNDASELCESVLSALLGFHLGGGRYLQLQDAGGPEYDGGYCEVPLAFVNAATFKGQP